MEHRPRREASTTDRAQSNQVGIIFMVALAVVGSAALAIFGLGLLEDTSDNPRPEKSFSTEFDNTSGTLTIEYLEGESVGGDQILLRGSDPDGTTSFGTWADVGGSTSGGELSPGDSLTLSVDGDERVAIVYESGDASTVVQTWTAPDA